MLVWVVWEEETVVVVVEGGFAEEDWGGRTEPLKGMMAVPFRVRVPPMGAVGGMMLGGGAALALVVKASRVLPSVGLWVLLLDVRMVKERRDIRVDGAHHARLAVIARGLAAVEPDRRVAVDRVHELDPRRRLRDRDRAAAESSAQGLARLVKGGLYY